MEIKVVCRCGQKYAFDVEPVEGRMPVPVSCPACGAAGTDLANDEIRLQLAAAPRWGEDRPELTPSPLPQPPAPVSPPPPPPPAPPTQPPPAPLPRPAPALPPPRPQPQPQRSRPPAAPLLSPPPAAAEPARSLIVHFVFWAILGAALGLYALDRKWHWTDRFRDPGPAPLIETNVPSATVGKPPA